MRILNLMGSPMTALLQEHFGERVEVVELVPDGPIGEDAHGDALLAPGRSARRPAADWLAEVASRVRWLHVAGAGVGDLPDAIFADGRTVTCSRGAMAIPISEFVLATLLAFEKRFPHSWLAEPPPEGWGYHGELVPPDEEEPPRLEPPPHWGWSRLGTLHGKVLGIFGFGSIGRATAEKALPFGMSVVAVRRHPEPVPELPTVEVVGDILEMAERADHIVCTAPSTPRTERIFGERVFARTKQSAHFMNVSRGTLVDQDALLAALDAGRLAFASLDVTDPEPLPAGHPLYSHPRVRITPHISWCSPMQQRRTGEIVIANVESYLEGRPLHGVVDPKDRY